MNTRFAQNGSAGGIIFLAVVFGLIWWQWDRIEGLFNIGGGGAVAEVYGFNCVSQSSGTTLMEGRVRNVSDAPIAFKVQANVNDTSNRLLESREMTVRPNPVPPQQQGEFRADGPPAIPDGGSCRFSGVISAETGYPVKWKKKF
jgi:hypothetical protein